MESQLNCERVESFDGLSPWDVLARVQTHEPLLFLGSEQSPYSMLALSFDEEGRDEFMLEEARGTVDSKRLDGLPMTLGQIALLTYDAYNPWCGRASAPSRFFRVTRSLVWSSLTKKAYLCSEHGFEKAQYQVQWPIRAAASHVTLPPQSVDWKSTWTDSQYLEAVAQSLEDIREGRFYQINLLRYWQHQGDISRAYLLRRLKKFAGPFSAFIDLPDLGLVSWSPERFVRIFSAEEKLFIEAEPIKGTRPVSSDKVHDAALMEELKNSAKDKAELHMIVDLMRNDLQRLAVRGGVSVLDSGTLHSFPNVHHLVATVRGELKPGLRLDEVCRALCPGGSITGAPKREVMDVIHSREERERGYFMGNLWYKDAYSGHIDSSILIRTAVRQSTASWEYAAGSGITVKSHAYEELQEVLTKARIVLENPW
ncbi:MAG: chorismate-binding protein [Chitinophagaceae bacterium]|nr:chorismate-binding protein [Oligoflexus sp.]